MENRSACKQGSLSEEFLVTYLRREKTRVHRRHAKRKKTDGSSNGVFGEVRRTESSYLKESGEGGN